MSWNHFDFDTLVKFLAVNLIIISQVGGDIKGDEQ